MIDVREQERSIYAERRSGSTVLSKFRANGPGEFVRHAHMRLTAPVAFKSRGRSSQGTGRMPCKVGAQHAAKF